MPNHRKDHYNQVTESIDDMIMATGFIGNVGAFFVGEALRRADQIFALVADR